VGGEVVGSSEEVLNGGGRLPSVRDEVCAAVEWGGLLIEEEIGVMGICLAASDGGRNRKGEVAIVDDTFMRSWTSL
jgi:hypothetical protein